MSLFVRVIVIFGLLVMVMGCLLLQADEIPAEVEGADFLDTSLGMLAISSIFLVPTLGSLGIIALANRILTMGGGR